MPTPLLYESHMHTPLCKHARGNPADYAAVALQKNLKGIIVTCHNPMPDNYSISVRMAESQWAEYLDLIDAARAQYAGRVDIRPGLECDYAPGFESYLEKQTTSAPFNHVLGSIHPQVGEYRNKYHPGNALAYQRLYFDHLAQAAETKIFDTLSHPDLIKNIHPQEWHLELVFDDILRALDRIAKAGTAMELNTSGLMKDIPEFNPGPEILREIALRKIPIVLGADAHDPERVADQFPQAMTLLQSLGHTHVHIHIDRKRIAIPIPDALASLAVL